MLCPNCKKEMVKKKTPSKKLAFGKHAGTVGAVGASVAFVAGVAAAPLAATVLAVGAASQIICDSKLQRLEVFKCPYCGTTVKHKV